MIKLRFLPQRFVVAGVLGCWLLTLAWGHASDLTRFSRAPYVQFATEKSIHIVWRTLGPIEPMVRYGTHPRRLDRNLPVSLIQMKVSLGSKGAKATPAVLKVRSPRYARLPKLHSAPAGTIQYEAKLVQLKPDTHYFYAIYDGETRLTPEDASYRFRTNPKPGKSVKARFWVVGDSGIGKEPQISVHERMIDRVKRDERPLDFYIHVGDMAYDDGKDHEFQKKFFEIYDTTLRNTVCWPAMGNHEGHTSKGKTGKGPYYDAYILPTQGEAGGVASGTEAYYSFDYGHIHFVCLDSFDLDRRPTAAMARWLKSDLERTTADWLIAYWHHPPYTKGSHDSDTEKELVEMRTHIMPILESFGVDIVLTGHSHIYERSMLMDGAYATPTVAEGVILDDGDGNPDGDGPYRKSKGLKPHQGTVQVVAGHGGRGLSRKGTMPVMKRVILEHGSVIFDVDGNTLDAYMINKDGRQRDHFRIVKKGNFIPTRLSNPRQLSPQARGSSRRQDSERLPRNAVSLVERNASWKYLAGAHPPSNLDWTSLTFNTVHWETGKAGFGYDGQKQFPTTLDNMKGKYKVVYLRTDFQVEEVRMVQKLALAIDYDDAFIAYINGKEVLRKRVDQGRGQSVTRVSRYASNGYRYYELKDPESFLRKGRNVLAIEGHNVDRNSSDFLLDPYLIMTRPESVAQRP